MLDETRYSHSHTFIQQVSSNILNFKMGEKKKKKKGKGYREMFRTDVTDFEFILPQISDLISPQERLGGTSPIECDERLELTLRYLATGQSFQSLSFQYRISLNVVSYIVKGCCKTIVDQMASAL